MATTAPPRWDLAPIFPALDDRGFLAALEQIYADVDRLAARYDELNIRAIESRPITDEDRDALDEILAATNELQVTLRKVSSFLYAIVTTDSRDELAAALTVELQTRTAALGPLMKRLGAWCVVLDVDDLAAGGETAEAHAFTLRRLAETAELQMSEAEESLAAQLAPSASLAWARLHGDVSSQLMVGITLHDGTTEQVPMALARGLATHPDAARRRAAYDGELAAWERVEVPIAAALNGAKGEQAVLDQRRGWSDDLAPALSTNAVDRETLDAMTAAVVDSLPDFRRYFLSKADRKSTV
jgi:oligoendopeptidase F